MSFETLFTNISTKAGLTTEELVSVQDLLFDNWYDSLATLRSLRFEDLTRMGMDEHLANRLIAEIKAELDEQEKAEQKKDKYDYWGSSSTDGYYKASNNFDEWNKPAKDTAKKQQTGMKKAPKKYSISGELDRFTKFEVNPREQLETVSLLHKIILNVKKEPNNPKYRKLKTSNQNLEKHIFTYGSIKSILSYIGFREDKEANFILSDENFKIETIEEAFLEVEQFERALKEKVDPQAVADQTEIPEENLKEKMENQIKNLEADFMDAYRKTKFPVFKIKRKNKEFILEQEEKPKQEEIDRAKDLIEKKKLELKKLIEKSQNGYSHFLDEIFLIELRTISCEKVAKLKIKFPIGNEIEADVPGFYTLEDLHNLLSTYFTQEYKTFSFRVPGGKKLIGVNSSAMKDTVLSSNLYPESVLHVIFDREVTNESQVIADKFN